MTGNPPSKTMRDALIDRVFAAMESDPGIFFVSADMGAPSLDRLRETYTDRFINVGIAEQNLINVSTGLALEGYTVFSYLISPFVMRAYEQARVNLAMSTQLRPVNVNIIAVGTGLSYDVSGPSHHCLEDLTIMRLLPNMTVFSPSDWPLADGFVDYALANKGPKYLRFDGKPLSLLSEEGLTPQAAADGFRVLKEGKGVCLVGTGVMTHRALEAAELLAAEGIEAGVVDVFLLAPFDEARLRDTLLAYDAVVTAEEGFVGCGGLDALVDGLFRESRPAPLVKGLGLGRAFHFESGSRLDLHRQLGMDPEAIATEAKRLLG